MPLYREIVHVGLVKWDDIETFVDENGLEALWGSIPNVDVNILQELYDILSERYAYSTFRYTDLYAALLGLRRIARFAFPEYVGKKQLYTDLLGTQIDDLKKERQNVRNLIEKPNVVNSSPDKDPIPQLSSLQETITQINGTIEELQNKWDAMKMNYINDLFNRFVPLFTKIITDSDDIIIYPQEGGY